MKIEVDKDWCLAAAKREDGQEVGVGPTMELRLKLTGSENEVYRLRKVIDGQAYEIEGRIEEFAILSAEIGRLSAEVRERRDQVEEYQQREDEIIVALGAEGILPSGIVGKINELRDDRDHVSQLLLDVGNEAIASTLESPDVEGHKPK